MLSTGFAEKLGLKISSPRHESSWLHAMVLILDGSSKYDAHGLKELDNSKCLRQLFTSKETLI